MIDTPTIIDHDHIIDSVVEIRLIPKNEKSFVLDILAEVRDLVPGYTLTPSNVPWSLRKDNPQLQFGPELTLVGANYSVGIGFTNIILNCQNGYKRWDEFFPFIKAVLLKSSPMVENILRIGVRFTNFFEGLNDFSKFNVRFNVGSELGVKVDLNDSTQTVIRFTTTGSEVSYNVAIASMAQVPNKRSTGMLLDIDAFVESRLPNKINQDLFDRIEKVHAMEKQMFFSLLTPSFLKSLNPVYR